jgi:ubiquinone/menaquinone biosynthesis C-methylase UbiE
MDRPMSALHFKFMSFLYKFRDLFFPRKKILEEVGIKPGFQVLDFGCGPGAYISAVADLVGKSGTIRALDIHPLAIHKVRKIAAKRNLQNVKTILSDLQTGLPDESIDVVLLYDILHGLSDPDGVLHELHRVLRPIGLLSVTDHHQTETEIVSKLTNTGLFKSSRKGKKTFSFVKENS